MPEPAVVERAAVAFGRVLRGCGLVVPLPSVLLFAEALATVGVDRPEQVYWAGRATLVHRIEDAAVYDRAFAAFFGAGVLDLAAAAADLVVTAALDTDLGDDESGPAPVPDREERPLLEVRFSAREVLTHKDFATYSPEEHAEARRLMADLQFAGARRRSRRLGPSRRRGGPPDVRRTLRAALRTGGEPLPWHWREPGTRARRIVFLCDVSGSMDPYARALLRFLHAAASSRNRVEVFALGTRLTRVSRELASRDPDAALALAARRIRDFAGGTRLGDGLRAFNDEWGQRGLARGAVVVILSDGWDRGDPAALAEQMQRLRRVAYRVVWVNPLKAAPGYAPLARGMAAALPYVDAFVEGHSLAALRRLTEVISQ